MNELIEMIKSLKFRDVLIVVFVLFSIFILIIWGYPKVTGSSNEYVDCLLRWSDKNSYDLDSGIIKKSYNTLNIDGSVTYDGLDQYALESTNYIICSNLFDRDYRKHVDEYGTKYPRWDEMYD